MRTSDDRRATEGWYVAGPGPRDLRYELRRDTNFSTVLLGFAVGLGLWAVLAGACTVTWRWWRSRRRTHGGLTAA
ncbi:hypothetical protein [Deinococcus pimensis]|uniref:hypothetical protein n=1 Tax=Deinococcus pimensis TaxID=309888 RepID=UPI0004806DAB|nr:hypothetical protein [Deinococcus pimensis]